MREQGGYRRKRNHASPIAPILAISALFILGALTAYAIWQISIPPGRLEVSPTEPISLTVEQNSQNPPVQNLTIKNSGGRPLDWIAQVTADWIKLNKATRNKLQPNASVQISLSFDTNRLPPGVHEGEILFSSVDSPDKPIHLNAKVTVIERPLRLEVEPLNLEFESIEGSNPSSQSFKITNSGGRSLTWEAKESSTWFNLSQAAGKLDPGENVTVSVFPYISGLQAGRKDEIINISAKEIPDYSQAIQVRLAINPKPARLTISRNSLSLTADKSKEAETTATITLKNEGGQSLSWQAQQNENWLTIYPASGILRQGQSMNLTIRIPKEGLSPLKTGSFNGAFSIRQVGGASFRVPVSLTVIESDPPVRHFVLGGGYSVNEASYYDQGWEGSVGFALGRFVSTLNIGATDLYGDTATWWDVSALLCLWPICIGGGAGTISGFSYREYNYGSFSYPIVHVKIIFKLKHFPLEVSLSSRYVQF